MTNLNNLYIKCYYDSNSIINKPENIPIKFLPNDYNLDKYTIIEKEYILPNDSFSDFHIETSCNKCYLCKSNINYENIKIKYKTIEKNLSLNENIFNKLEDKLVKNKNINNLFSFQSKISLDSYIHYYYHLCETCYKHSLYYWSISNINKYPSSGVDGYRFINQNDKFVPEIKNYKSIEIINKLNIPNVYICNYFNCENNTYNYLDTIT